MGSEGPETQANTFPQVIHSSGSKGMCCGCKRSFQTDFCKVTGDFPVLAGHKDWHACTSLITVTFLWQRPWTINNDAEEHSETCLLSHVRAETAPWARIYLLTKRARVTFAEFYKPRLQLLHGSGVVLGGWLSRVLSYSPH